MTERPDAQALLAKIRAKTAAIDATTLKLSEQRAANRAARADAEKAMAAARRDGEYGRDWQVLQQRIDTNRTTLADIFTGVDKSEEARAVRKAMEREGLPRVGTLFSDALASDDMAEDLASLERAQKDLAETLARFRTPEPTP